MARRFVKICGITDPADALAAVGFGADALGFNFYAGSSRHVTADRARAIAQELPPTVMRVGVFVNSERAQIEDIAHSVGLTALQFHGDEPPSFCTGWAQTTIKAMRVGDRGAAQRASEYRVDFILVDAYVEGHFGGTGKRIEVEYLDGLERRRLILAGGLNAGNVAESIQLVNPFGVDVASGVESAPGKKDRELMRRFIENARAA